MHFAYPNPLVTFTQHQIDFILIMTFAGGLLIGLLCAVGPRTR